MTAVALVAAGTILAALAALAAVALAAIPAVATLAIVAVGLVGPAPLSAAIVAGAVGALAAALPELPYACGLNTSRLLADDLVAEPLTAVDGVMAVTDLVIDPAALERTRASSADQKVWQARIVQTRTLADRPRHG